MFDRIAPRYDLLNRLLSARRDVAWRKRLAGHLPPGTDLEVLDLATGTGDVLVSLCGKCGRAGRRVGVDMSSRMLAQGQAKLRTRGLTDRLMLVRGDATHLGIASAQFDAVTMAFGIRNVTDVAAALDEMHRILKPDGRALILEFSLPRCRALRWLYLAYFRHVLPRLGSSISGDPYAYRYLNQTVESFPYGKAFCDLMAAAGFRNVIAHSLTFGIATLYCGDK